MLDDDKDNKSVRLNSKKNVEFAGEYVKRVIAGCVQNEKKIAMVGEYWQRFCGQVCKDTLREIIDPRYIGEGSLNSFK